MMYDFEFEEITCCLHCPMYDGEFFCCNLEEDNAHLHDLTYCGEGRPDFCKLKEHDEAR